MSVFMDVYVDRARRVRSVLCVGLDPTPDHVPSDYGDGKDLGQMETYLRDVIEVAAEKAAVVKPQFAYYEALGPEGIMMMIRLIEHAHVHGLLVILDHKVVDIGATMEAYGRAVFDQYKADACTFTPLLGGTFLPHEKDRASWLPWLDQGKGVITMIRTSNPHAVDFQDALLDDGRHVYQMLADMANEWAVEVVELTDGRGMVAGVVGATTPEQAVSIRERVSDDFPFLIPGFGIQGGVATDAVAGFSDTGTPNCFVNSSRGITRKSWQGKSGDPMNHVAAAIDEANVALNEALEARFGWDIYTAVA